MSKRFGRNQRRRMREELAERQLQVSNLLVSRQMDQELLKDQGHRLRAAEAFARDVAEIVGREAIIAGVLVKMEYEWTRKEIGTQFQLPVREPMPACLASARSMPINTVRAETMHLLAVDVVADVMRRQMHLDVRLADGHQGYAISGTALHRLTKDELFRVIAPRLAEAQAQQLKLTR